VRRALVIVMLSCSHENASPPPKVADAPIHDTAPIPTASTTAPEPVTTSTNPMPVPIETTTSSTKPAPIPSTSASAQPKGALTSAECDKVIHKFAELVAEGQNAQLLEGFQQLPLYGQMRDECVKSTTRKQYDCAMSAKTHQKWQECMK
jgi:hypothetical protein